jgi:N-acetylneuraminate synthase
MSASTGFEIAGRRIGRDAPPFIIAEMSGNHNHSLERSLSIVDAAASAGAHALKIQTFTISVVR